MFSLTVCFIVSIMYMESPCLHSRGVTLHAAMERMIEIKQSCIHHILHVMLNIKSPGK